MNHAGAVLPRGTAVRTDFLASLASKSSIALSTTSRDTFNRFPQPARRPKHTRSARALEQHKDIGTKRAREQGSKGAREQGSKGAREQGSKGAREQGANNTAQTYYLQQDIWLTACRSRQPASESDPEWRPSSTNAHTGCCEGATARWGNHSLHTCTPKPAV